MTVNLNDDLIARFGLTQEKGQVERGFTIFAKNSLRSNLGALHNPDGYTNANLLQDDRVKIIDEICRQLHLDASYYRTSRWDNSGFIKLINDVFDSTLLVVIYRLQIILNIIYKYPMLQDQTADYIKALNGHLNDYPILSIMIKLYKTKPPQIFPTTSKEFTSVIYSTLDMMEKKYATPLEHYESGLKGFLTSKTTQELKDVVEDMYTACDTIIQSIHGGKNGLRSLFIGKSPVVLGLNQWQLKIFDELRDWMDKIKHGSTQEYDRSDVEMIILSVSMLIKLAIRHDNIQGKTAQIK